MRKEIHTHNTASDRKIIDLEREAHRTAQYTQYETLEFSKIPLSIPDNQVQSVVLNIVNSLGDDGDNELRPEHIQACHRRQGKFTKENVLLKLIWRGDVQEIKRKRKTLKDIVLTEVDPRLTQPVYINDHLTNYYGKLRYICKQLWMDKKLQNFWVAGHKVKAMVTAGGEIKTITHKSDFTNMYPGMDLKPYFDKLDNF